MRKFISLMALLLLGSACIEEEKRNDYTAVSVDIIYEDSVSIRAIDFLDDTTLAFAGSKGLYGTVNTTSNLVKTNTQRYDSIVPEFRAIAHTATNFFMLSVAAPALLYKTGDYGKMELVYKEEGEGVFYDAMKFWNNQEGIAIGDSLNGCLSIIITRDGGKSWQKVPCALLPDGIDREGAFAASNTNIAIQGNAAWIATTEGRVYYSLDKGNTWKVTQTPIIHKEPTQGIYSMDFYNANLGFAIGGDYLKPEAKTANKITTTDGGKTWQLIADGSLPNYKSCVQFVPNSDGKELVALGFTGIDYSNDGGTSWKHLSDESFYTLKFLNDSVAYAAGKNRIAKLVFK